MIRGEVERLAQAELFIVVAGRDRRRNLCLDLYQILCGGSLAGRIQALGSTLLRHQNVAFVVRRDMHRRDSMADVDVRDGRRTRNAAAESEQAQCPGEQTLTHDRSLTRRMPTLLPR